MKKERKFQKEPRPSGSFVRELSLWALLARGSIYKILTILVIMVTVEVALFYVNLRGGVGLEAAPVDGFEGIFAYSGIEIVFLAAFCLVSIALLWNHSETHGSIVSYTLGRLRVTGRHLFWVWTAYNFLCFVLLFAVQIWTALWLCQLYREVVPSGLLSPQLEFLAFYRTDLLHSLLPLADAAKWVEDLLMLMALSTVAANRSRPNYRQSVGLYLCAAVWWLVLGGMGLQAVALVWCGVFIVITVVSVLRGTGVWGRDESVQESE